MASRGSAIPKLRCSPRSAARPRDSIRAAVRLSGTSRSGRCVVTGTVRSVGPASIITTLPGEMPQRSATNSVWPGCWKPMPYSCSFATGPVTTAAAEPERARPTASSSESSEQCAPATLGCPGTSASAAESWISGKRIVECRVAPGWGRRPPRLGRPKWRRPSGRRRSRRTAADRTRRGGPSIWRSLPDRSRPGHRARLRVANQGRVAQPSALAPLADQRNSITASRRRSRR